MTDPDECAHRIAHDLHQAFLSGVLCAATAALEVDHIQPWSKGGSFDDPNNLQILCRPCNATKGASWVG